MKPSASEINSEISTWEYLASVLTQPHQQGVKAEIEYKIRALKQIKLIAECPHPTESLIDYHDMSILCRKCHEVIYQSFNGQELMEKRKELGMT